MHNPIYNITPFTMLDFPGHTACILWFAGCNMRCLYCYNPEIVLGKGQYTVDQAAHFLQSRRSLLQGVVFSGGECTIHKAFIPLVQLVKSMGYLVKVDTNGSKPEIIKKLIDLQLVDYVALDFKALPHSFEQITASSLFPQFEKSLTYLTQSTVAFEVRTTWHQSLISQAELQTMVAYLIQASYRGKYFIQAYRNDSNTLSPLPYSPKNRDPSPFSTADIQVILR